MRREWRIRLAVSGTALLPLAGMWLGHAVEYVRVWGPSGLGRVLFGSAHAYMLPLAALLACLGALSALRWRILWVSLAWRLERARVRLAGAWRGQATAGATAAEAAPPSRTAGFLALLGPVLAVQLALYLLGENVEAWSTGLPAPGLGALSGVHWAAPLVHAVIAAGMCALSVGLRRRLGRLARSLEACERLLAAVAERLGRPATQPRPMAAWLPSPTRLLGKHVWRRPPPAPLPV